MRPPRARNSVQKRRAVAASSCHDRVLHDGHALSARQQPERRRLHADFRDDAVDHPLLDAQAGESLPRAGDSNMSVCCFSKMRWPTSSCRRLALSNRAHHAVRRPVAKLRVIFAVGASRRDQRDSACPDREAVQVARAPGRMRSAPARRARPRGTESRSAYRCPEKRASMQSLFRGLRCTSKRRVRSTPCRLRDGVPRVARAFPNDGQIASGPARARPRESSDRTTACRPPVSRPKAKPRRDRRIARSASRRARKAFRDCAWR